MMKGSSPKKAGVSKKKFAGKFTVNRKTGAITVKKGLKKGTYKVKVQVICAGTAYYKPKTVKAAVTVKVK